MLDSYKILIVYLKFLEVIMQTILRFLVIYCLAKRSYMDNSRKNRNRRDWGHIFGKRPLEFSDLSLYPRKFQTKWSLSLKIPQNCVTPIAISKVKSQDPWKFHMISSGLPQSIPLLLVLTPGISTFFLFSTLHVLNLPVWIFFWNSPTPNVSYT